MRRLRSRDGFSLIEVLLATLVLGLFFSLAFAKQAESVVLESRARMEAEAAVQVRCKVSELELLFLREGFPAADEEDSGPCCEAFENERFACSWRTTTIELPTAAEVQARQTEQQQDQSLVPTEEGEEGSSFLEQTQGLLSAAAMGQVLPVLQSLLTGAIRRVEVTVAWRYQRVVYDFTVSLYVTNTSQGPLSAFLQQDLIQRFMQDGPSALMDLFLGGGATGDPGASTGGTGGSTGGGSNTGGKP